MPTSFAEQFYLVDAAHPPAIGTPLSVNRFTCTAQDDDGTLGDSDGDSIDGSMIRASYPDDCVRVASQGAKATGFTGITYLLADGRVMFSPTNGQVLIEGTLQSARSSAVRGKADNPSDLAPVCFTPGTLIAAPDGAKPVQDLKVGDLVSTRDGGPQPIRWISSASVDGRGPHAPIRFAKGRIGNSRELLISPQHRVVVSNSYVDLLFGEPQVLVAATHLVDGHAVARHPVDRVDYIHFMLDRHHIVFADGAPVESLDPHSDYLSQDPDAAAELRAVFPELCRSDHTPDRLALPILQAFEGRLLAHQQY